MKIIIIMDGRHYTLDHVDPMSLSLYALFNHINTLIIQQTNLLGKYPTHRILLSLPYVDEDGITGVFHIDTHYLDFYHRYDLRLFKIFQYLSMTDIPNQLIINVDFHLGEVEYHNDKLFSQISRGRTLSRVSEMNRFLKCLPLIYDLSFLHDNYFDSDCHSLFKLLLVASIADTRLPEVTHQLCIEKLSYWDKHLTGTPRPLADKCSGKAIDLIDFYHAYQLNARTISDSIICMNLTQYVNNHLKILAKLLFFPEVPLRLKLAISKTFPQSIFQIVRHHIEKHDATFYNQLTADGDALALMPAKDCVREWANSASKDQFKRVMTSVVSIYNDPDYIYLLAAQLSRTRRKWLFNLEPVKPLRPSTSLIKIGRWATYSPFLFHPTAEPLSDIRDARFMHYLDNLLNYLVAGQRHAAKRILENVKNMFPDTYWQIALQRAECYEAHTHREWLISPLEFVAHAGDIDAAIMLLGLLPDDINVLKQALTQLQAIMPRAESQHRHFMSALYKLKQKYAELKSACITSLPERIDAFRELALLQQHLPIFSLQALCHSASHSIDSEPIHECNLQNGFVLDTNDLGKDWILVLSDASPSQLTLESPLENYHSKRDYNKFLTLESNVQQLYAARLHDFSIELSCLQNRVKQLEARDDNRVLYHPAL